MMAAEGGGFYRIGVATGLVGVINAFRHAIENASGCAVMAK